MKPATLRRKLQKKLKHKPWRKCPQCGERADVILIDEHAHTFDMPRLFVVCGAFRGNAIDNGIEPVHITKPRGCGYSKELFWSGSPGGIGRHIPLRSKD